MITFDTGALVAIERRRPRMRAILEAAWSARLTITVPATAWGEWHAGAPRHGLGRFADAVSIAPLTEELARVAGRALADLGLEGMHFVDATVMATAAALGGVVYTSDFDDLEHLQRCFPAVRVLTV
jgi:predicted nucleic acid-binding protein